MQLRTVTDVTCEIRFTRTKFELVVSGHLQQIRQPRKHLANAWHEVAIRGFFIAALLSACYAGICFLLMSAAFPDWLANGRDPQMSS